MKMKRRWNERTRLMLTLELAVVLPAAALVILGALHLNESNATEAWKLPFSATSTRFLQFPRSTLIKKRMK